MLPDIELFKFRDQFFILALTKRGNSWKEIYSLDASGTAPLSIDLLEFYELMLKEDKLEYIIT